MEVIACVVCKFFVMFSTQALSAVNEFPELHTRWVIEHTWFEEASWTGFLEEELDFCPPYHG